MLSAGEPLLERIGGTAQRWVGRAPWTNVYGVGRTLIALGTIGVVVANDPRRLFVDHAAAGNVRVCSGLSTLSLFCHASTHDVRWAQLLAVVVLLAAASGWRPRWTCIPHWWITFSVATSVLVEDGGDQAATVLTLLLVPVALADARKWAWSEPRPLQASSDRRRLIAFAAMLAIRIQVSVIYFQSFTGKLAVKQWLNGTAVYYYLHNPYVGSPSWLRSLLDPLLHSHIGVGLCTYGTLVTELLLCLCLFLPRALTNWLLWAGIGLHLVIALLMGLPGFSIIMWGALVLYLRDWTTPLRWPSPHMPAVLGNLRSTARRPSRRMPVPE